MIPRRKPLGRARADRSPTPPRAYSRWHKRQRDKLYRQTGLNGIDTMSGIQFEEFVAAVLRHNDAYAPLILPLITGFATLVWAGGAWRGLRGEHH
jgi:hypothetical protein